MAAVKRQGKVVYKANLAGDNWLVRIDLGEKIDFLPGQFVSLKVSEEGLRRSYSVASLPGENYFDLVIDVSPMGVGSKYILGLKVGDTVEVLGFLGKFVIAEEVLKKGRDILFVGTGTGIAPLKPMIENLLVNDVYRRPVYLVWGMRYETDLYWMKEISDLQRDFDNFHFEIVLSRSGDDWPGLKGHVQEVVEELPMKWSETAAYLCGSPEMISETKVKLIDLGVADGEIYFERFA